VHTQVSTVDVCGFYGKSPSCALFLQRPKTSATKQLSPCPEFYDISSWLKENKSSGARPCTNVGIPCEVCDLLPDREGKEVTIWKLNMREHILKCHPDYAVPGWPSGTGKHPHSAANGRGGLRLPADMIKLLEFRPDEEQRLGISASQPWSCIGTDSATTVLSAVASVPPRRPHPDSSNPPALMAAGPAKKKPKLKGGR
jgi:hypothetical protein